MGLQALKRCLILVILIVVLTSCCYLIFENSLRLCQYGTDHIIIKVHRDIYVQSLIFKVQF